MEALAGVTAQSMADEMATLTPETGFAAAASGLAKKPLLVVSSDDGLAADLRKRGDGRVSVHHEATDHSWSGKRIALEAAVIGWLQALKPAT